MPPLLWLVLLGLHPGPHGVEGHVVPLPPVIVEGQAPDAPESAPASQPEEQGPPAEPAPAEEPGGLGSTPEASPEPVPEPLVPAGDPLDLFPAAPVDGFWAYVVEVAAAMGTAQLLAPLGCVPGIGPVAYAILAPPAIVHTLERTAGTWTTTPAGHREAALITAHIVEALTGLFMLGGQIVLMTELTSVALLAVGAASGNNQVAAIGGGLLAAGTLGGLSLLGVMPLGILLGLGGPHLEVLVYRYLRADDTSVDPDADSDYIDDEVGFTEPESSAAPPPSGGYP